MNCSGCGSKSAVVTRTWFRKGERREACDDPRCGNLRVPWSPDVYFKAPEMVEHLADQDHPFGRFVDSPRHKARIMLEQGVREDGDRVHGSIDKGAIKRPFKFKPGFEDKLSKTIKKNIGILKRRP